MIERRKFSRISFEAPASITQGITQAQGVVNDLSLHGLLVTTAAAEQLSLEEAISVNVPLDNNEVTLSLQGEIVANVNNELHIRILKIDVDSISHLRRLVELNIADEALLNRDLESLTALGES